jgi:glycosyltransferase involved in cell wall biosynthesis
LTPPPPAKTICMVVYTDYRFDARVRREAETLADSGFRVICLTPSLSPSPRRFTLRGVEVRELPVAKYQGKSAARYVRSYLHFLMRSSLVCARLMRRPGIDAVHVHNLPDFLVLSGLVPRLFGRKVVLDIHDSVPETFAAKFPERKFLIRVLHLEERASALLAHRVICVNHPQRDRLVERGLSNGKAFVSMNVPDHRIFARRSVAHRPSDGRFRLVYHGTMARRLGVDLIVEAAAMLAGKIPGLEVYLWGPGDDLGDFRRRADELRMNGVVRFRAGGYPLEELPERLTAMDLGVVGNRRNPATELMLPVKLMEYVSLGIPVVAPRIRTIAHYFSDQMVAFYEPDDPVSMSEAILRLHADTAARERQAAKAQEFLDEWGWERQGPALVDFYRELLAG